MMTRAAKESMWVDLNCDMGESFGIYRIGMDEEVMPLITSANVACGFHGGDPDVMARTVELAKKHGVGVGAHEGETICLPAQSICVHGDTPQAPSMIRLLREALQEAGIQLAPVSLWAGRMEARQDDDLRKNDVRTGI